MMPPRPSVLVTRRLPAAVLDQLRTTCDVDLHNESDALPREDLCARLEGKQGLVCMFNDPIDAGMIAAGDELRVIATVAVGYDNIDVGVATELGIPVSNTPGVLTDTTADLTWALLLSVSRNIVTGDEYMRGNNYKLWGPNLLLGEDTSPGGDGREKILGVVGFGRIGQAVTRRAMGFDMRVLAYDPYAREAIEADGQAEWADLDQLLTESDFVSIHTLLSNETRHLISTTEFEKMKPTAYILNAARGPIIDEAALVVALNEGEIAGAGLDVYEREPKMVQGLAECKNTVLLPHLGSASRGTRDKMATMAATNAIAMLQGDRAPNCVNADVYDSTAYAKRSGH